MKRYYLFIYCLLLGFIHSYAQNEIELNIGSVAGNSVGDIVSIPVTATSTPGTTNLLIMQGTVEFSNPAGLDYLGVTLHTTNYQGGFFEVSDGIISFSISGPQSPIATIDQDTPLFDIEVEILDGSCTEISITDGVLDIEFYDTDQEFLEVDASDTGQVCIGCIPDPVMVTADGVDITDTLMHTLPCEENTVEIEAVNLSNVVYLTSTPGVTNVGGGVFTVTDPTLTAFIVIVGGEDSCGDPYGENITIHLSSLQPIAVIANNDDITTTLAYALCETDNLDIDVVNISGATFYSQELNVTNTTGEFSLPNNNSLTEFTVLITGRDSCDDFYNTLVIVSVTPLLPITITANGDDITGQSFYDICNSVDINANNVFNAEFESEELGITNNDGIFTVPTNNTLTSFKVRITGENSCGKYYGRTVTINILDNPHITEVNLVGESYVNTSGNSPDNHGDYTGADCIPVFDPSTPRISITTSELGLDMSIYIDHNDDGFFNNTNEFYGSTTINAQPAEFSFANLPIVGGETLRIIVSKDQIFDGNLFPECGEVEDYKLCPACEPATVALTANGEEITDMYTIPCGSDSVDIDATNLNEAEFFSPDLGVTNNDGVFNLPSDTSLTSFKVEVSGKDSCGNLYSQLIYIEIEQDCNTCMLEALTSISSCSDNGTPLDPTDDYYNITLDVFNTGGELWTVVDSNGLTIYFGDGDENNVDLGNYLVLNGSEGFQIRYGDNCFVDFAVAAPTSCNFSCNIEAVIADIVCVSEDSYIITLHVLGTNGNPWQIIGHPNNQTISYSGTGNETNIQLGPISTNDASWILYITSSESDCDRYETTVFAPDCRTSNKTVLIAPNPTYGEVNISLDAGPGVKSAIMVVYDFNGSKVHSQNLNLDAGRWARQLNLGSQLRPGIYFLTFIVGDETITKQIIIR